MPNPIEAAETIAASQAKWLMFFSRAITKDIYPMDPLDRTGFCLAAMMVVAATTQTEKHPAEIQQAAIAAYDKLLECLSR